MKCLPSFFFFCFFWGCFQLANLMGPLLKKNETMEATQDRRFYFEVKNSSGVPFSRTNRSERRTTTTFAKIVQLHTHTHTHQGSIITRDFVSIRNKRTESLHDRWTPLFINGFFFVYIGCKYHSRKRRRRELGNPFIISLYIYNWMHSGSSSSSSSSKVLDFSGFFFSFWKKNLIFYFLSWIYESFGFIYILLAHHHHHESGNDNFLGFRVPPPPAQALHFFLVR